MHTYKHTVATRSLNEPGYRYKRRVYPRLKPFKAFIIYNFNQPGHSRSLGPPWASRLSRGQEHFLPAPVPSRTVLCPTSFKMAPRLSARCPPITLIGEPKGLLSVAGWWAGLVHPVPHCPCPLSRPRPTWRDATVCVRACCVCELQAAWHMHT